MADREKVINELDELRVWLGHLITVGYHGDIPEYRERKKAVEDALALLREQEPVKPNTSCDGLPDEGGTWWYVCGNCSNAIDPDDAYCRHCGRQVKWDD